MGAKKNEVPASIVSTKLYSTVVLAAFLAIHPRTLESWRRLGTHPELKWTRVGRRIRYSGQAILDFLDDGTSPQPKRRGVR